MGVVYTLGGSAGPAPDAGIGTQFGILWQPGNIDKAAGGNVGLGVDASAASVGVSWSVEEGMEKDGPQRAIPGFSLAFTTGIEACCKAPIKLSPSLSGGYATLVNTWRGDPIVTSPSYLYAVQPNGDL